ncbi:unnamed protein product [Mesocestoides corti]|uniref:Sodium/calcium exchanger membrane region domain-containing protein n=1 Tax=Mesocestoides corti TaxID=53468 RepID=A0A0R3UKJ5_MESCO|nr:unnamed protein product [Mesocestoides corti]
MNFGIASAATESPNDLKSGRGLPSTGDAPNSSVCRHRLNQVVGHAAKCNISRDFRGCRFDSGFISYLEFQYCQFSSPVAPTILMGVTLLAFGNGAPDVFSAVTAITTGDPEAPDEGLGLGFLMGESSIREHPLSPPYTFN